MPCHVMSFHSDHAFHSIHFMHACIHPSVHSVPFRSIPFHSFIEQRIICLNTPFGFERFVFESEVIVLLVFSSRAAQQAPAQAAVAFACSCRTRVYYLVATLTLNPTRLGIAARGAKHEPNTTYLISNHRAPRPKQPSGTP